MFGHQRYAIYLLIQPTRCTIAVCGLEACCLTTTGAPFELMDDKLHRTLGYYFTFIADGIKS